MTAFPDHGVLDRANPACSAGRTGGGRAGAPSGTVPAARRGRLRTGGNRAGHRAGNRAGNRTG